MKKRLALGVLMGCLITGNMVWAAESIIAHDNDGITYETKNVTGENITIGDGTVLGIEYGTVNDYHNGGQAGATSSVLAMCGGTVNLGDANTKSVVVTTKGQYVDAVMADNFRRKQGGVINVNSEKFVVNAEATDGYCYAVRAMNRTTTSDSSVVSKININAKNTIINASIAAEGKEANAITAWSQGEIRINDGNLYVKADNVINTRGQSLVEINKNNNADNIVQLNGNIAFKYDGVSSGTTIDSKVILNLSNKDSYLNGNIGKGTNVDPIPPDKADVMGMNLGLSNGGTWNTDGNSFVNNLTFNDGVINVNGGADQKIQIDNVAGSGGDINIKGELDNGVWKLGEVVLGKDDNSNVEGKIDLNLSGVTADDIEDSKAALDALAGSLSVKGNDDKLDATGNIQEGLISGGISSDLKVDENGVVSVDKGTVQQGTSTTTMDSMRDIASVAIAAWRQEDSSLGQRLGELRSSEGDQGIWTRMSRGEFEYNDNFKNQYNFFQLGYDKAYGDWHYGAAISHNDGKTSYANGSGENSSLSLSLYGTWLGNDGEYADIVLKQGRLSNEFDIVTAAGRTVGDYDMWGTSLSGEYGKKIKLNDGWYLTPQGQLTLMYIGGEDYTTSNGIMAEQDSMTSLVGRVGFEMGKAVNDKGRIFAKASLLHDFNGKADTRLTLGDKHNSYTQDLGETWYEAGIGVSYKVSKASYIYADVMKTFGGDLETPWQWNAGVRYSF